MSDSVVGAAIITGINVVAVVIIGTLGIIDGAIVAVVGTVAIAPDFKRAIFVARPP